MLCPGRSITSVKVNVSMGSLSSPVEVLSHLLPYIKGLIVHHGAKVLIEVQPAEVGVLSTVFLVRVVNGLVIFSKANVEYFFSFK